MSEGSQAVNSRYKVLALDIDGTLTTSEKIITAPTREAVIKLQENNIKVIIASGRSEHGFVHILEELECARFGGYAMSFNGGRITECATGNIVYDNPLALSYLPEIYELAVKYGLGIIGYEDDCLISGNGIDRYQEYDAWACRMQLKEVSGFPEYFKKPFNKCLLTGEPEHLREVLPIVTKQFEGRLNVFLSEEFFIEVLPKNVHKAEALKNFIPKLGADRDELMCIGDGGNDITMIEYAGMGVAMANANPALIEKADYVTDSNDNDGVLKAINRFFYGQVPAGQ